MSRAARASLTGLALLGAATDTLAQEGPSHPTVEVRMVLRYSFEPDQAPVEVPLELPSLMTASRPDQEIELAGLDATLRVLEYLPLAAPRQRLEVDDTPAARPAVRLSIVGPKLSYERCLTTDSPKWSRMTSLIATWRYAAAADQEERDRLFAAFVEEPDRPPRLHVALKDGDATQSLPVVAGEVTAMEALGCNVRVLEFFGHYNFDQEAGEPVNLSDKRTNPAVLVELEGADGRKEERWVFARFPDYVAEGTEASRYTVTLDCPVEKETPTPDYVLAVLDGTRHELWSRSLGEVASRPLALREPVDIPGSNYTFQLDSFLPAARLVEEFVPTTERRGSLTALHVELTLEDGEPVSRWLEMGRDVRIPLPSGALSVSFGQPLGH